MPQRSPAQYNGPLTPAEASRGIDAAAKNAESLLTEANILLQAGHFARATALAILALEEVGKVPILRELILLDDPTEIREAWKEYRRHISKNTMWILPRLLARGAEVVDQFMPMWDPDSDHPASAESTKQKALYTDAYGPCTWSLPADVIEPGLARLFVEAARILVTAGGGMRTEQELVLWRKHLRPVRNASLPEMKAAFRARYEEAKQLGVLSTDKTPEEVEPFSDCDSLPLRRLTTRWSRPGQLRRIGSMIGSKRWPGGSSRGRWAARQRIRCHDPSQRERSCL